jgi:hypothetical protein
MMEGVTTPFGSAELTQGPNLYWYVYDNPAKLVDPSGLKTCCPADLAAAKKDCSEAEIHVGEAALAATAACGPLVGPQVVVDFWLAFACSAALHILAAETALAYDDCHQCDNQ